MDYSEYIIQYHRLIYQLSEFNLLGLSLRRLMCCVFLFISLKDEATKVTMGGTPRYLNLAGQTGGMC